jgi:hypothetical protein
MCLPRITAESQLREQADAITETVLPFLPRPEGKLPEIRKLANESKIWKLRFFQVGPVALATPPRPAAGLARLENYKMIAVANEDAPEEARG